MGRVPTAVKPCRVRHVRVHLTRRQSLLHMQHVDQLAQCAGWCGRATFSFVLGQAGVDAAATRLQQRLGRHEVQQQADAPEVVQCRRK